jgi:superfamily II DNA/RNA helicase
VLRPVVDPTKLTALGYQILVATPGRLLDLVKEDVCAGLLRRTSFLVLDEADKLMQSGLLEQVEEIRSYVREDAQRLLFTATMADTLKGTVESMLNQPHIKISADVDDDAQGIAALKTTITQTVGTVHVHVYRVIAHYQQSK